MTWWQTLLVSVVPVLITLVVTNRAESKRRLEDSKERRHDRDAQIEQRESDRKVAERASWRDDKRRVHQEMLSYARWLRGHIDSIDSYVSLAASAHTDEEPVITIQIRTDLDQALRISEELNGSGKRLDELIVGVQIHCSEEAIAAVKQFEYDYIGTLRCLHEVVAGNGLTKVMGANYYFRFNEQVEKLATFVDETYPAIARRELHPEV